MFLIKKIITPFLLPPGIFVTVLLAAGGWNILRRRFRAGGWLSALGLFMWLAATPYETRRAGLRSRRSDRDPFSGGH